MGDDGLAQRTLKGPPQLESSAQRSLLQSRQVAPFSKRLGLTLIRDHSIGSPVSRLLDLRRPAHVSGRVRAVVVDAVDRMFWRRSRPHVSKECLEGLSPPLTDGDASAAIERITLGSGITASVQHPLPNSVFGNFCLRDCTVLRFVAGSRERTVATPPASAQLEMGNEDVSLLATVATSGDPYALRKPSHQNPFAKALAWFVGAETPGTSSLVLSHPRNGNHQIARCP